MLLSSSSTVSLDRIITKVHWRLLPILIICFIISIIMKNIVALSKFKMADDLSAFHYNIDTIIGLGQAAFSVGYILIEIPGTLIADRWSARKWFCLIAISWGVSGALTAFVKKPWHFYVLRFLLGLCESSYYPGVIVYFTHWFPSKARAKTFSFFLLSLPISQLFYPKFCYYFLRMDTIENGVYYPTLFKLKGWQMLYIACGILSVVFGIILGLILPDRPSEASWLSEEQRQILENKLIEEKTQRRSFENYLVDSQNMPKMKVALLSIAYFLILSPIQGIDTFMPTMLSDWYKPNDSMLTWILMIPPIGTFMSLLFNGWHSDRMNERRLHTAVPILIGAISLGLILIRKQPLSTMIVLFTMTVSGLKSSLPVFWSLTSLFLSEATAAASIGLINSVGNSGGIVSPILLGVTKDHTGSFHYATISLVISLSWSALIIIFFPSHEQKITRNDIIEQRTLDLDDDQSTERTLV